MESSITLDCNLYYKIWEPLKLEEVSQLKNRELYVTQFGLTLFESSDKYDINWWGTLHGSEKSLTWFLLKHA